MERDQPQRRTLIIFRLFVSQDGAGIINRPRRFSDEERIPSEQIIIRPQGEAVPERAKRFRVCLIDCREELPRRRMGWAARPGGKRRWTMPAP